MQRAFANSPSSCPSRLAGPKAAWAAQQDAPRHVKTCQDAERRGRTRQDATATHRCIAARRSGLRRHGMTKSHIIREREIRVEGGASAIRAEDIRWISARQSQAWDRRGFGHLVIAEHDRRRLRPTHSLQLALCVCAPLRTCATKPSSKTKDDVTTDSRQRQDGAKTNDGVKTQGGIPWNVTLSIQSSGSSNFGFS